MKNSTKERLANLFLEIEEATATSVASKTESAYKFLRKTVLPLSHKQQKLLHYAIVHKMQDGNGTYSYIVQARYNGNTIAVTATTLDEAKALLTAAINGEAQ